MSLLLNVVINAVFCYLSSASYKERVTCVLETVQPLEEKSFIYLSLANKNKWS